MDSSFYAGREHRHDVRFTMPHLSGLQASRVALYPAIGSRGVSENTLATLVARLRSLLRLARSGSQKRRAFARRDSLCPYPAFGKTDVEAESRAGIGSGLNGLSVLQRPHFCRATPLRFAANFLLHRLARRTPSIATTICRGFCL